MSKCVAPNREVVGQLNSMGSVAEYLYSDSSAEEK